MIVISQTGASKLVSWRGLPVQAVQATDVSTLMVLASELRLESLWMLVPEVYSKGKYGVESDWFLLGLLAHRLLCPKPEPTTTEEASSSSPSTVVDDLDFPEGTSPDVVEIVSGLLKPDVKDRFVGFDQVSAYAFFKTVDWKTLLA